ncbi:MAG: NAD-dependent DNA ligase LigA, partial [Eubacterium sp.]|nr:NAD-dependent DNA ligase LigA [Eubacterium sp.]
MDTFERYNQLCKIISKLNHEYYDLDNPSVSDYEYDRFMTELKEIEAKYPLFINPDSPSQKVGGTVSALFQKVEHTVQMGSLQDVFNVEDLYDFDKRVRRVVKPEYVIEPKIDGLSVSLEYRNGKFIRGSTRGDGIIGEDITDNLRVILNVPKELKLKLSYIEVRGEVYLPRESFSSLVAAQLEKGERPFKNPRNAAAGSLRQKDSEIVKSRGLDIYCFNIQQIEGHALFNHIQSLKFMENLGFKVIPGYILCSDIDEAVKYIAEIGEKRSDFRFDIDGAVIKVNSFLQRDELGSTSKFPKWAAAFKYPPEEKHTTVTAIEVNVGRTGALTPLAV